MKFNQLYNWFAASLTFIALMVGFASAGFAQDPHGTDRLGAAPPMRTIPEAERTQIHEIKDSKSRIKKTVDFADGHLLKAENAANQQQFDLSLRELGYYLGCLEDAFHFAAELNSGDRGKSRDLYKHLELALRAHGPRLTVMRRATPLEYASRMKEVEEFAREGRTDALNAFYGHTVVRDSRPTQPEEKPKPSPPNPERQH